MNISFLYRDKEYKLKLVQKADDRVQIQLGGKKYQVAAEFVNKDEFILDIDGKIYDVIVITNSNSYTVFLNGKCIQVKKKSAIQMLASKNSLAERKIIRTSMPGRIVKVLEKEGSEIKAGQPVIILEAMKMHNEIKSPQPGKILKIGPNVGDSVEAGTLLFTVE